MPYNIPPWFGIAVFGGICGAALWKGGWAERLTALWLLAGWMATVLIRDHRWTSPQWGGVAIDAAFFVFLLALALKTDRFWPLFAAGFQLLSVVTHLARLIDPVLGVWVYVTAGIIWTYLVLASLAFGVWSCWRTRAALAGEARRHGAV